MSPCRPTHDAMPAFQVPGTAQYVHRPNRPLRQPEPCCLCCALGCRCGLRPLLLLLCPLLPKGPVTRRGRGRRTGSATWSGSGRAMSRLTWTGKTRTGSGSPGSGDLCAIREYRRSCWCCYLCWYWCAHGSCSHVCHGKRRFTQYCLWASQKTACAVLSCRVAQHEVPGP